MNKALVTVAVLLGSSSVAMAKPATFSAGASVSIGFDAHLDLGGRAPIRDHRTPAPVRVKQIKPAYIQPAYIQTVRPVAVVWNPNNTTLGGDSSTYVGTKPFLQQHTAGWHSPTWRAMTEPTRIDRGREFFTFGAEAGGFRQIQLVETTGSSNILQVAIEFVGGGRTQKVELMRDLCAGESITIDLDGDVRQINRIVVYGSTAQGAAYQILGR